MVETDPPAGERTRSADERASTVQCINVIVIGAVSTGKSCLSRRFTEGDEMKPETATVTLAPEALTKDLVLDDGTNIDVLIWDTVGQERFNSLPPNYYRRADAVMLVYDITSRASFDTLPSWYSVQKDHVPKHVVLAVVGTKVDQEGAREVPYQEGHAFARKNKCLFFETSALSGQGVSTLFTELLERALEARLSAKAKPEAKIVYLTTPPPNPEAGSGGCSC